MRPADRRSVLLTAIVSVVLIAALSAAGVFSSSASSSSNEPMAATSTTAGTVETDVTTTTVGDAAQPVSDLVGDEPSTEDCTIPKTQRPGDSGAPVTCLQQALIEQGFLNGQPTGQFDAFTADAVKAMQTERQLFVDGVVGRETAISLGVWPDEQANVIRTPKPAKGAKDLMGFTLSSVASSGPDAPPLPPNSGTGRRLVYERAGQRVWAVDKNNVIIRSWLVSGSKYSNEQPGIHQVYSRSEMSTAWNGKAYLPKMVRWLKTDIGAIGFHALPRHVEDNSPYQTEAELGTRLSGGCQRQADLDAAFTWAFAQIGTRVVVL